MARTLQETRYGVRCLSAQLQARFRMGYELSEPDEHDLRLLAEVGGAVEGADFYGFDGGEAVGVDEELDLALVAEAGEGAAVAGGVGAAHE